MPPELADVILFIAENIKGRGHGQRYLFNQSYDGIIIVALMLRIKVVNYLDMP